MLWLILALIAGIADAINNVIIKKLASLDTISILYPRYLITFIPSLILIFSIPPPTINHLFYIFILIACLLDVVAVSLLIKAIKLGELATTFPLVSFTPIFIILTSFFILNELPSITGLVGIFMIVSGAYLLRSEPKKNFFYPFSSLVKDRGARYMLLVAFLFSLAGPSFKKAMLNSSLLFTATVHIIILNIALAPVFFSNKNRIKEFKQNIGLLAIASIVMVVIILSVLLAFKFAIVPYVVSIKRLSILFTIIFGHIFFKEKNLKKNLIAGTIMIIGAFLIGMS